MTVQQIITAHLLAIGADGLCTKDCGCGLQDLIACAADPYNCVPARQRACGPDCPQCDGAGCFVPLEDAAKEADKASGGGKVSP